MELKPNPIRSEMGRMLVKELGGQVRAAKAFRVTQPATSYWCRIGLPMRIEEIGRLRFAWLGVWQRFKEYEGLEEKERI
jgi:hypothetical protein